MYGLIGDTVGGINQFIAEQRKLDAPAFVTLTTFDHRHAIRYHAKPLADVPELTVEGYYGGHSGSTALLDAVGQAIAKYESLPVKADKTVFVIVTDGDENASREYRVGAVRESIKRLQEKGYAFIFLGANDSAWQANEFGVNPATTGTYAASAAGTSTMYSNLSRNISATRSGHGSAQSISATQDWSTGEADKL